MKRALTFVLTVILVLQLTTTVFAGAEEIAIQIAKQKYSEAGDFGTVKSSSQLWTPFTMSRCLFIQ